MKKVFLFFLLLALGLMVASPRIMAQDVASSPSEAWLEEGVIYTPKLLPTSPLYFLKRFKEKLELNFAFSLERKVQKRIEFATRRLAEARALMEKNPELADQWIEKYQEQLSFLEEGVAQLPEEKSDWLREHVGQMVLKHQLVLMNVYNKAPDAAKAGLERALENSFKGYQRAMESVSQDDQAQQKNIQVREQQLLKKVEQAQQKIGADTGVLQRIHSQLQERIMEQQSSGKNQGSIQDQKGKGQDK